MVGVLECSGEVFALRAYSSRNNLYPAWIIGALFMIAGAFFLALANCSVGPFPIVILFLGAGVVLHWTPGFYERRAFVLAFSVCVLVAGLSQFYTQTVFDQFTTSSDAETFYHLSTLKSGSETIEDLFKIIDAPLPIIIWHYLYAFSLWVGLDQGPWLGVLLNSFLVGLSGSLTVRTGRYVFGNDHKRLKLLGTLFASSGIFWLFGAIFLRDSFALFLNVLILYAFIRVLAFPNTRNVYVVLLILSSASFLMAFIRTEINPLIVAFVMLSLFSLSRRIHNGSITLLAFLAATCVVGVLLPFILPYVNLVQKLMGERLTTYLELTKDANSLGYSLIVNQALPIRLIAGSVYMHVFPIPLWAGFTLSSGDYHWLKSFHGFFLAAIAPFGFFGWLLAMKQAIRGGPEAPPFCFLAFYAMTTLLAVVATSLETRHYGQFLPAFLLLTALPDRGSFTKHSKLTLLAISWYGSVIAIHMLWLFLKFF